MILSDAVSYACRKSVYAVYLIITYTFLGKLKRNQYSK